MEPTPKPDPEPARKPVEPEPVVPPAVSSGAVRTGKMIIHTSNAVSIVGIILTIVLAVGGATWNLRGFITSQIEDATAATNARLETAIADIRQEIRSGRESTDRQMAEIRGFIFNLYGEDNEDDGDDNEDEDDEDEDTRN